MERLIFACGDWFRRLKVLGLGISIMRYALLPLILLKACAPIPSTPETFGFVFHENTGITTHLLKGDQEIAIAFSADSEEVALTTLRALDWPVLYPNADGRHIFIEGYLSEEIRWTPDMPHMAVSEPYHEFRLTSWYIQTPFAAFDASDPTSGLLEREKIVRHQLDRADFQPADAVRGVALSRFVKQQKGRRND